MSNKPKFVLIDGNSLLYRAFYAMPHFSTLENQATNAVYGMAMMLLRLLGEEKPEAVVVAFDAPAKTFRHEEFAEYKAHRKRPPEELLSQGPIAREMINDFGITMLEVPGYEADDIIGTVSGMAADRGYDVLIVTGDLDELQLVNDNVKVMTTVKGVTETVVYDEKAVANRYDGLQPHQLVDYKALKGDPSDNIPGVPGIGEKTALRLIKQFGSLERILEHLNEVSEPRVQTALRRYADQALMSKRLATIERDVPLDLQLERCCLPHPDYRRVRELFKRLEFRSLLKRLPGENIQQGMLFAEPGRVCECKQVRTRAELKALLDEIARAGRCAVRIHGTSAHGVDAEAIGLGIAVTPGTGYYVQFGSRDGIGLDDLRPVLESEAITKHGHNLKYEFQIARKAGICLREPLFDVMLAAYLVNPARSAQKLADVAFDHAGIELPTEASNVGDAGPRGAVSAAEAEAILRLADTLRDGLARDGLESLMYNVEMPLVPVLADMELAGVAVDSAWLAELSVRLQERIETLEREIYSLAGLEFNIASPKQLSEILFDKLGLPSAKKTKTGFSTDADTLAALAPAHEIVAQILRYRELTKLKSTYADVLPKLVNSRTGRIHTSLNQAVTATGRLSSSDPNLQNIPIKSEVGREIRKAFIASPGNMLLSADYSQIELRILAHMSRDPELLRAFREGQDIHTKTATKVFGIPAEEVTPEMRRQAKTVNFAVIYGMSDYGLSRQLGIPASVARQYIESYFREYPGVRAYADETLRKARAQGYVETLLGRRRYLPELQSANRVYREFAERAAVNMPVQGTAADIMKLAMISIAARIRERGFQTKMILQVHDELVFDVPETELNDMVAEVVTCMEQAFQLDVRLEVDVKAGKDWCTAQPFSAEEHEPIDE